MTKSELIQRLAEMYPDPRLYHRDFERVVNKVFDEISAALARGDRVELRGFGAFSVPHDARQASRFRPTTVSIHNDGDVGRPFRRAMFRYGAHCRHTCSISLSLV